MTSSSFTIYKKYSFRTYLSCYRRKGDGEEDGEKDLDGYFHIGWMKSGGYPLNKISVEALLCQELWAEWQMATGQVTSHQKWVERNKQTRLRSGWRKKNRSEAECGTKQMCGRRNQTIINLSDPAQLPESGTLLMFYAKLWHDGLDGRLMVFLMQT